jgi:hypothetical protein
MSPHKVLIVVDKPAEWISTEQERKWQTVLVELTRLSMPSKGIERLSESVLLLPLNNGLHQVSQLLNTVVQNHFGYRALFLAEEDQWIYCAPPTTQ